MGVDISKLNGDKFSCPSSASAIFVGAKPYGSSSGNLKIHIPALMPQISSGEAKVNTPYTINKSMFANAGDCGVSPMNSVRTQNYVTAKATGSSKFQHSLLWYGAALQVRIVNQDGQTVELTNRSDPSFDFDD